jgi:hypothetical protein
MYHKTNYLEKLLDLAIHFFLCVTLDKKSPEK